MSNPEYWKAFTVVDEARTDLGGNCRHGDPLSTTPALWSGLIDRFAPASMLDIGCGEGQVLSYFMRRGVIAHGIDGLEQSQRSVRHPFAIHDLTKAAYYYPCDLVYCVEVVEHIEERYLDYLLDTLANAPVVAMTHAQPGQPGHHHVNLKLESYWIEAMRGRGYHLLPENQRYRDIAATDDPGAYFARTGLVFACP